MSAGLAALLDDIAALARLAAASVDDVSAAAGRASAKAAGVVVDDAAVTPQYVQGVAANRELPIIAKIAKGSLINKLAIIVPAVLAISVFIPWLLTPILMVGGTYLSFEGAEKIYEKLTGHDKHELPTASGGQKDEDSLVKGAVRTDFILSAEIMVISLNEVADEPLLNRIIIMIVVAIGITLLVYGVVALIVRMDDLGLRLAQRDNETAKRFGLGMVRAMPKVLTVISTVGIAAMLWVGGHILLVGAKELGWSAPYELVHHAEEAVAHAVPTVGGLLAWLTNTAGSALCGIVVGAIVVAIMHLIPRRGHGATQDAHA